MKNFFIVLFVLILLGLAGFFAWRYFSDGNFDSIATKTVRKNKPFVWGVTTRAFALSADFQKAVFAKQIAAAKQLNVDYVRINWEKGGRIDGASNPLLINNAMIDEIIKADMRPYVIIIQRGDMTQLSDPYTEGYNLAFEIAKEEKGKVDYYQLENEITSWSLNGAQFSGDKTSDYDSAKSEKICQWLKGANAGVKAADPAAKTVITGQWVQYAFLQIMADEQVDYDVIGWDWFSDMGPMKDNKMADGTNILDKLLTFNKPVMLVEVGQRPEGNGAGFKMNEVDQAKFIGEMAEWAKSTGKIKGFFAFELTDVTNHAKYGYVDRYGLIQAEEGGKNQPGQIIKNRQAFATFQEIIAKHAN